VRGVCALFFVFVFVALADGCWFQRRLHARRLEAKGEERELSVLDRIMLRGAAPFVLQHALSRGLLHMIQVLIGFLFMLAAM
jgi:hypothetical protein